MTEPSTFTYRFRLRAKIEETFELFSTPDLLNAITPSWFDLEPDAGVPELLEPGVEIGYRLRWRGISLLWVSRIVEWEPPYLLTYEQARGPYRSFRHEHVFAADTSGTRVVDRVAYRVPGGVPVERLLVRPDLERIFRHRAQAARLILEPVLPDLATHTAPTGV